MKVFRITALSGLVLALAMTTANAGDVTVKNVHVCCGACVKGAKKALGDVDGVSGANADRDSKTISFTATDEKSAQAGIKALAKAGFHGKAAHGDKVLAFPKSGAKKDAKSDSITLNGVHLCCMGCVRAAKKAVNDVKGVDVIDVDRKEKTVTLKGSGIKVAEAVAALNKAGFHGSLKKKSKKSK